MNVKCHQFGPIKQLERKKEEKKIVPGVVKLLNIVEMSLRGWIIISNISLKTHQDLKYRLIKVTRQKTCGNSGAMST